MDPYLQRFNGIARLYGEASLQRFRSAHAVVVGVGGVGSWSAEALARSGIGRITLIDLDEICISNSNRQLHTLHATIGLNKAEVMGERLKSINPEIEVTAIQDFFTSKTAERLLEIDTDIIIDAIDSLQNKCLLLAMGQKLGKKIVTVGGAGGRRDPTKIQLSDLAMTSNDALLRSVRRELRKKHDFPEQGNFGIPAIFSTENPVFPDSNGGVCSKPEAGQKQGGCEQGYGAASFVTGAFGFAAASAALGLLT